MIESSHGIPPSQRHREIRGTKSGRKTIRTLGFLVCILNFNSLKSFAILKNCHQKIGFEDSSLRKYKRLTRGMKPNLEEYVKQKAELEEDFYPDLNNLSYGFYSKVPESKIDELVEDLQSQYVTFERVSFFWNYHD